MNAPFQWGKGGRRMTPEQIEAQSRIATSLARPDFSPVSGPWAGLARVAGNAVGAFQQRSLNRAQDANAAETQQVLASLGPGEDGKPNIAALLAGAGNPYVDDSVRQLATSQYGAATKPQAPLAPHYWETNNGSLGMVGPDGKPQILYTDPTPKIDWITTTNPDGTKTLVPMPQGGGQQAGGGLPPQLPPSAPVGKLTPLPDGGPGPQALATFPGPLQGTGRGY